MAASGRLQSVAFEVFGKVQGESDKSNTTEQVCLPVNNYSVARLVLEWFASSMREEASGQAQKSAS